MSSVAVIFKQTKDILWIFQYKYSYGKPNSKTDAYPIREQKQYDVNHVFNKN